MELKVHPQTLKNKRKIPQNPRSDRWGCSASLLLQGKRYRGNMASQVSQTWKSRLKTRDRTWPTAHVLWSVQIQPRGRGQLAWAAPDNPKFNAHSPHSHRVLNSSAFNLFHKAPLSHLMLDVSKSYLASSNNIPLVIVRGGRNSFLESLLMHKNLNRALKNCAGKIWIHRGTSREEAEAGCSGAELNSF